MMRWGLRIRERERKARYQEDEMLNIIEWEPYNRGECYLIFFDRKGKPFSSKDDFYDEFLKEHKAICGFRNKSTGGVVLINHYGEIAAKGG